MKVKELIALLQQCNPDSEVFVPISQYNKVYPVHYAEIGRRDYLSQIGDQVRIDVSLAQGMFVTCRKS